MLVTRSTRLPSLDPCIRQRFTFLEVRGAAIITRRDLFKGWAAPDIGGTIAEQRCPCTVYASTTSMWKLNNSRYRKAHSALFIPDNNELVRQREYLLSTTGFHLRVLSRAPRNPFSLSNHPPSLSFYRFHSLHSPSFRPSLRGASSPLLSLARVYPSRQPSSSRPSLAPDVCDCQCLPRTYYRDDVAALWRSAREEVRGEEERKIAETCVRNCLRLDRCGFPQRIIIIRGIPAHGRDYLMKELLGGGGGGRWKR